MEQICDKNKIQNQLSSLFRFFEILGIHYFQPKDVDENNIEKKPSSAKFSLVIARLMFFVILSAQVAITNSRPKITNLLLSSMQIVDDLVTALLFLTALLETYLGTTNVKRIYFNLNKLQTLYLYGFSTVIDYKRIEKRNLICLSFVTIFVLGLSTAASIVQKNVSTILSFIGIYFLISFTYFLMFLINLVNIQLQLLIKSLQNMSLNQSLDSKVEDTNIKSNRTNSRIILSKIQTARQIYNLIHHCGNLVNQSFGFSLLLCILVIVISETLYGFRVFMLILEKNQGNLLLGKI